MTVSQHTLCIKFNFGFTTAWMFNVELVLCGECLNVFLIRLEQQFVNISSFHSNALPAALERFTTQLKATKLYTKRLMFPLDQCWIIFQRAQKHNENNLLVQANQLQFKLWIGMNHFRFGARDNACSQFSHTNLYRRVSSFSREKFPRMWIKLNSGFRSVTYRLRRQPSNGITRIKEKFDVKNSKKNKSRKGIKRSMSWEENKKIIWK